MCLCICLCLYVCLWVCYHDNSKLRASIFTKLGLWVKVVTISSWLNFGRPPPPGRSLRRGENFWLRLTTASAQCLRLSGRFFHSYSFNVQVDITQLQRDRDILQRWRIAWHRLCWQTAAWRVQLVADTQRKWLKVHLILFIFLNRKRVFTF